MTEVIDSIRVSQLVKEHTDFLISKVDHIEEIMNRMLLTIESSNKDKFGKSQIRNLLTASKTVTGVKELSLFIEYQIGRDKDGNNWGYKTSKDSLSLGKKLIEILKEIESELNAMVTKYNEQNKQNNISDKEKHEILMQMLGRFFLYWSWKYHYLAKSLQ